MKTKVRLSEIPLMGYFRFPKSKVVYQAITYPTRLSPHAASREVLIPGKKGSAGPMKCSLNVILVLEYSESFENNNFTYGVDKSR